MFSLKSGHIGCIGPLNDSGLQINPLKDENIYFFEFVGQVLHCSKTPRGAERGVQNCVGRRTKAL